MRKFKKLCAFVTAMAISASMFTGLIAFADDDPAEAAAATAEYSLETGKISVTYEANAEAYVIVARYNNNALQSIVKSDKVKFDAEGKAEVTQTLQTGDKILLWDSLDGVKPILAAPYVVPSPSPTPPPFLSTDFDVYSEGDYTWGDSIITIKDNTATNSSGFSFTGNAAAIGSSAEGDSGASGDFSYDIVKLNNTLGKAGEELDISFNLAKRYNGENHSITLSFNDANGNTAFGVRYGLTGRNGSKKVELLSNDKTAELPAYDDSGNAGKWATYNLKVGYSSATQGYVKYGDNVLAFNASPIKSISFKKTGNTQNRPVILDDLIIKIDELIPSYFVTYDVDGTTSVETVEQGKKPASVPATDKNGYIFKGWKVGSTEELLSTDEVKALELTGDVTLTAQYELDSEYKQTIAKIEFITPSNEAVTYYPSEEGAVETKEYTVKVTSDIDMDITADCTFAWEILGEGDDGYTRLNEEDEDKTGATRNLRIRQGGEPCFGYIKATATYTKNADADTAVAQKPFAVVTNSRPEGQFLPAAGYLVSMDDYKDNLIGYKATADVMDTGYDIVLDNWCIVGSSPSRDMELVKEDDKKAIKITNAGGTRGGNGSSCLGVMVFPSQKEQYVLETTVKFGGNARIGVWDKTPNQSKPSSSWTVSFDSDKLNVGTETITGLSASEWYKLVVTNDPTNAIYSVYVYDLTGTLKGKVEGVTGSKITEKYLVVDSGFPVYINSLRAYIPTVDTVTVNADPETVKVPETAEEAANTSEITAVVKTTEGIQLTSDVNFTLAQEYQGVELVKDSAQKATVKVSNGAAGTVKVNASVAGKTGSVDITLTNSSDTVYFKAQNSSITIPFEGSQAETGTYTAVTIDKNNQEKAGTITYSYLDKNRLPMENLPSGITATENEGTLTLSVAAGATPAVFYIKATNGDGLSTNTQVNVHGLSYSFGTTEVEGDTQVLATTLYTDLLGYGFEDTTGLLNEETDVKGTASYKFKAKVPNGNYNVKVTTTSANMYSEIVDEALAAGAVMTGIHKSGDDFNVAVCDGVLDLSFDADSTITSLAISQINATKREKPAVFAIGDSTTNNKDNGGKSWGNCVTEGDVTVPDVFSGFENHGMAGRDSVNFYNQGRVEAVLLKVRPGDYVTINMGINSRPENGNESAAYPILMSTYYAKAVEQRGGIPVIVTATPDGPTNGSWGSNMSGTKFTNNRGTGARNGTLRKIAQENNYNIIELGYAGEEWLNSLTDTDVTAYNTANGTSFTTVAEMAASWYVDHNHYKQPMGEWIGNYILNCVKEIEGGSEGYLAENDSHITEQ